MRKLAKVVIALLCLLLLTTATLYGLLFTKFATPVANALIHYTLSKDVTAKKVVYQSPWTFEFEGVTTNLNRGKAYIPKVTIWVNRV